MCLPSAKSGQHPIQPLDTILLAMGIFYGGITEIFTGCHLCKSKFIWALRNAETYDRSFVLAELFKGVTNNKKAPGGSARGLESVSVIPSC
jgi:succinate-acetate transporter protein